MGLIAKAQSSKLDKVFDMLEWIMTDKKEPISDVEKQRQELMARLKGAQSQMKSSSSDKASSSGFLDVMIKSTGTFEKQ
ncbi:hypothetical protein JCM19235_6228 [Vibrio maritimus]|uniref:Uncharacterized protein n=2 Tax=Vibrionaceae TaxID=641 RepID=A0A090RQH6_9VIBR|nr:hypothetical protein JCM19235_6228 [Vibrio maritimus]